MAERPIFSGGPALERALADLGRELAYPPTPNLAAAVRLALAERPANRPAWWHVSPRLQRRVALVLAALVVLAGGVLAVSPEARTVVADRLGLRGVQITQQPGLPTAQPSSVPTALPPLPPATASPSPVAGVASPAPTLARATVGARLSLGRQVSLDQARAGVTFQVALPNALGAPDEVYLSDAPAGGQVSLVYYPRPDLPQTRSTGVGMLLTEFQGDVHSTDAFAKGLPSGTRLEEVRVNGGRGLWVEGDPHAFFFLDARGQVRAETTRLAGNTLLWERGAVTLRLESALTRDAVLAVAQSVN